MSVLYISVRRYCNVSSLPKCEEIYLCCPYFVHGHQKKELFRLSQLIHLELYLLGAMKTKSFEIGRRKVFVL